MSQETNDRASAPEDVQMQRKAEPERLGWIWTLLYAAVTVGREIGVRVKHGAEWIWNRLGRK